MGFPSDQNYYSLVYYSEISDEGPGQSQFFHVG